MVPTIRQPAPNFCLNGAEGFDTITNVTLDKYKGQWLILLFYPMDWTFVCPTCQCYDIRDFDCGRRVLRYRCWDSCMYADFTKMSAGQPRLTQLERFRQRFMHKLVYFPTNNDGMFSCVGCGRCLAKCPIQMNIVKVMKKLGGKDNG